VKDAQANTMADTAPIGVVRAPNAPKTVLVPGTGQQMLQLVCQQVGNTRLIRTYLINVFDVFNDDENVVDAFVQHLRRSGVRPEFSPTRSRRECLFLPGSISPEDLSSICFAFIQ